MYIVNTLKKANVPLYQKVLLEHSTLECFISIWGQKLIFIALEKIWTLKRAASQRSRGDITENIFGKKKLKKTLKIKMKMKIAIFDVVALVPRHFLEKKF